MLKVEMASVAAFATPLRFATTANAHRAPQPAPRVQAEKAPVAGSRLGPEGILGSAFNVIVAASAVAHARGRRTQRRAGGAETEAGGLSVQRRMPALGLAALMGLPSKAQAVPLKVNAKQCMDCAGDGTIECGTCKGKGQFRMMGFKDEDSAGQQYQYVECQECYGAGVKLCPRCYGTGLPSKQLRGFLRDPAFAKIAARLKEQRVDLQAVKTVQQEVKEALALQEEAKKAAAAENA